MTAAHPLTPEEEKSNARMVVAELLTGFALKSRDISEILSRRTGREISAAAVSHILFRISDPEKCDLGYFIGKSREGNALVYTLAREALTLSESKAYDLTLKKGADRYTLEQALRDCPDLQKYTKQALSDRPVLRVMKKPVDKSVQSGIMHVGQSPEHAGRTMEFSLRYSDRYALSVTASFSTFVLICCVLVLVFGLCCFAVYTFLMPIFITAALAAVIWGLIFFRQRK